MPQLSDAQRSVLTTACERSDRCAFPVTLKLKGNAVGNVLKSLVTKGLIEEVPGRADDRIWRYAEDGSPLTLRATDAAFAALGIEPEVKEEPAGERIAASLRVAFPDLPDDLAIEATGSGAVLVERRSRWVLAEAASDDAATHAKWRKTVAGIRKRLAAGKPIVPTDARTSEAPASEPAGTPAPAVAPAKAEARPSRETSKQAQLVAMLRRPEGASIEEIVTAFGWQKHTVRGAIAGALKKKLGLEVISAKVEGRGRVYRIA